MSRLAPVLPAYGATPSLGMLTYGIAPISECLYEAGGHAYEQFLSASKSVRDMFVVSPEQIEAQDLLVGTYNRLESLRTWGDDWDGCGALAPDPAAIANAKRWITSLFREVQSHILPLSRPNVTANVEDEIVFEWRNGARRISVYVTPTSVEYVKSWGMDVYSEMADGDADSAEAQRDILHFLAG